MNINVLEYIIDSAPQYIEEQVEGTEHSIDAAIGVAKFIIGHNGDVTSLSSKQKFYWDTYLAPLLHVRCEGVMQDQDQDTCTGNGFVDDESLLSSYQEEEFLCQHCRYDRDKMASA